MLINNMLAISRCDTLRPLGISFEPFANNVRDTKYHVPCSHGGIGGGVGLERGEIK